MFRYNTAPLLRSVETEQWKKFFIKRLRQGHVLDSDLDVINERFHGIFRFEDLGRVRSFLDGPTSQWWHALGRRLGDFLP
jgi:hypothetical protein